MTFDAGSPSTEASEPLASFYPALAPPISLPLATTPSHACPYFPARKATLRTFMVRQMPGEMYHDFMDAGFRRNGDFFYQPVCAGCRACVPLRVSVTGFRATKSQKRCWRKNQDLEVTIDVPIATEEKFKLFERYQVGRHESSEPETFEDFRRFLYVSPIDTIEFSYRTPDGRLVGVGICDICDKSLSSVYFYFDPSESKRGLGTFGALYEISFALSREIGHYYLGYWIEECGKMTYKTTFQPSEILHTDGVWRPFSQ